MRPPVSKMSRQKHGKTPLEVDSLQDKDTEDLAR
jgi:hypothetical protein